jgi:hypothetical protein
VGSVVIVEVSILRSSTEMTGTYCRKSFHRVTFCTEQISAPFSEDRNPKKAQCFRGIAQRSDRGCYE